ncbi:hypothetical protein L1887_61346 [Cichorium endivia]|nr:hypothetical protein L1887_61346 [Cichorium endivia]
MHVPVELLHEALSQAAACLRTLIFIRLSVCCCAPNGIGGSGWGARLDGERRRLAYGVLDLKAEAARRRNGGGAARTSCRVHCAVAKARRQPPLPTRHCRDGNAQFTPSSGWRFEVHRIAACRSHDAVGLDIDRSIRIIVCSITTEGAAKAVLRAPWASRSSGLDPEMAGLPKPVALGAVSGRAWSDAQRSRWES